MAIAFKKYINITSGVGGASQVAERELIARLFTDNPLVPTGGALEFTTKESVLSYFGSTSEEYQRAQFYFDFVSQNITSPQKISYAFWPESASNCLIFGDRSPKTVSDFTGITDGEFVIIANGVTWPVTGVDYSAALSLSDVATLTSIAINAFAPPELLTSTVTYDPIRGSFNFDGGTGGDAVMDTAVSSTGGTDILPLLGWVNTGIVTANGAIFSDGADAETVTENLTASADGSDNFGSFLYIPALTNDEIEEAAIWNAGENVKYMFMFSGLAADAAQNFTDLGDYGGTGFTVNEVSGEYPEMLPMAVLAATRYNRRNSTYNYMYQQADGLTPSVTDTITSDSLDSVRANYYGETQKSGRPLSFYQRGTLYGSSEDPLAMNVYANEIWLKDAAATILMNLLLAIKVSANKTGRAQLTTALQDPVDRGLNNGVISVGKPLNTVQKLFIDNITGIEGSWYQVQNVGYWFEVLFEQFVNESGETEFKAVYTLIYSKDDTIRSVDGTHILI